MMSQDKYVNHYFGEVCPFCKSDCISESDNFEVIAPEAYANRFCYDCGSEWRDRFVLKSFRKVKN